MLTGHIKQLSFENKFLISHMDYAFRYLTRKDYTLANQFMGILYFESIKAESFEYEVGRFPVRAGIGACINKSLGGIEPRSTFGDCSGNAAIKCIKGNSYSYRPLPSAGSVL